MWWEQLPTTVFVWAPMYEHSDELYEEDDREEEDEDEADRLQLEVLVGQHDLAQALRVGDVGPLAAPRPLDVDLEKGKVTIRQREGRGLIHPPRPGVLEGGRW